MDTSNMNWSKLDAALSSAIEGDEMEPEIDDKYFDVFITLEGDSYGCLPRTGRFTTKGIVDFNLG